MVKNSMNVGFAGRKRTIISAFSWTWLIASLLASGYFAFWMWPELSASRSTAKVGLLFQIKDSSGATLYYPNTAEYRRKYGTQIATDEYVYFSKCELLSISQRPSCDISRNWRGLSPKKLNCTDFASCLTSEYTLSNNERTDNLSGVVAMPGATITGYEPPRLTWTDPSEWGPAARVPLFFLSLFVSLKLGRALGEFLFTPYEQE
jgi:hypothetical protein